MATVAACAWTAAAAEVRDAETSRRDAWLRDRLLDVRLTPPPGGVATPAEVLPPPLGLEVLANNDPVLQNHRGGRPLMIGDREYSRGLYCHAVSKVVVRLPGPGKTFSAIVGVDANNDPGVKGSVIFSVTVGGREAFRSDVLRGKMPGVPIEVDLAGAREFVLEVGDAGDGIGWDQSDWADARVVLQDGTEQWLGEMPLTDRRDGAAMLPLVRRSELPFAFVYGGRASDDLLALWPAEATATPLGDGRTRHDIVRTDPETGLEVRCRAVTYADHPVVEWTVFFRNGGASDTPVLENIRGLDVTLPVAEGGIPLLRHWRGDTFSPRLYEPLEAPLPAGASLRLAPDGGRGTNGAFPYWDLETDAGGMMLAAGWPGQWSAEFTRGEANALAIRIGQEITRLRLKPGEQVRTPLMAILFRDGGDTVRGHNLWRRWMIDCNLPRDSAGALPPNILFGNTSLEFNEMINANTENQTYFIDRYREEGIRIDYWWMDAGWYPCNGHWPNTGTWEPDTERFPGGLRVISDHGRLNGVKTLVWFEPERVAGGTWIAENHPEWLLGPLLNLGNPEARQWLTDHVDRVLTEQGIDLYRQDFNMDPLGCWRGNDTPDRIGMTENLHVQGYLAYWDELRARHPDLIIDSCASGGRRNDLETMRRAVALHPTDFDYGNLTVKQAFHHSLYHWIPYFGSNTVPVDEVDAYAIRSGHGPALVLGYDLRRTDRDYSSLRELTEAWRRAASCYFGDFYPLTPYSLDDSAWIAWQFHLPEEGRGVMEAFRRPACEEASRVFRPGGLKPEARYEIRDLATGRWQVATGAALATDGFAVEITDRPGAVTLTYREL